MENTLIEFFSALNSEKIEYCLLRGEDELSQGMSFKEVDILVMLTPILAMLTPL